MQTAFIIMRKESGILLQVLCMAVCNMLCGCGASSSDSDHILWYDSPAQWWEETLPLGNGRLGMMAEGGIGCHFFNQFIGKILGVAGHETHPGNTCLADFVQQFWKGDAEGIIIAIGVHILP